MASQNVPHRSLAHAVHGVGLDCNYHELRFLSAPALTLMAASAAQARSPLEVTAQVWYAERRERIVFVESAGFWWLEDPGQ